MAIGNQGIKNRKKVNFVDIVLVIMIMASILTIAYMLFFSDIGIFADNSEKVWVQYNVRIEGIDESLASLPAADDLIYKGESNIQIGIVKGVEVQPYKVATDRADEQGMLIYEEVEGKKTVILTVEYEARITDRGFFEIEGCDIAIGSKLIFKTRDLVLEGYCISVSRLSR